MTQSPSDIVLNRQVDFNAQCRVEFGSYVQTHEEYDNSVAMCILGAITNGPTGNAQGGYYVISLNIGHHINRHDWTPLPMLHEVIQQVHHLA